MNSSHGSSSELDDELQHCSGTTPIYESYKPLQKKQYRNKMQLLVVPLHVLRPFTREIPPPPGRRRSVAGAGATLAVGRHGCWWCCDGNGGPALPARLPPPPLRSLPASLLSRECYVWARL